MYPEIIINTYIKMGDDFINVFDFNGHIDNPDNIDGAIELSIYGKNLLISQCGIILMLSGVIYQRDYQ